MQPTDAQARQAHNRFALPPQAPPTPPTQPAPDPPNLQDAPACRRFANRPAYQRTYVMGAISKEIGNLKDLQANALEAGDAAAAQWLGDQADALHDALMAISEVAVHVISRGK